MAGVSPGSDESALIEAFSQTATAYANETFLLLGMVGDQFVSGIFSQESAMRTVVSVQKRIRKIRSKINLALGMAKTERDRRWLKMLDGIYICLDQQAWAMSKYVNEKIPARAKHFDDLRNNCIEKLNFLEQYHASFGSSKELPAPLSTR
jgi:hypothetical protein